jgi:acyl-CoA synthetase (AMP-forming)/AMP-acid ligase II
VGDWCLSGDLAVWHADGYVEIKGRSKDIIISGGENISTLEVEEVLSRHEDGHRQDPKFTLREIAGGHHGGD